MTLNNYPYNDNICSMAMRLRVMLRDRQAARLRLELEKLGWEFVEHQPAE